MTPVPPPPFHDRLVHLDLKGAPPTIDYLLSFMDTAASAGATGFLVEWEDSFPWSDRDLRSPTAYTEDEVRSFLDKASRLGLEIVPLLQTFGHLEFVLKHPRFRRLREKPEFLMDLCPLHDDSSPLVLRLVDDLCRLHPGISRIHLGGDEVWSLASCEKCAPFAGEHGRSALYLHHMEPVFRHVRSLGLVPMVWDDMMRKWPPAELRRMDGVQLVVWRYGVDIEAGLPDGMWDRFADSGLDLLAASAFKGAIACDEVWADVPRYARNHLSWLRRAARTSFSGIVLTGWSRYNHTTCLCETLPAAVPSLVTCLDLLLHGGSVEDAWARSAPLLGLPPEHLPGSPQMPTASLPEASFPGSALWRVSGRLAAARSARWHAVDGIKHHLPEYNGGRRNLYEWLRGAENAQKALDILLSADADIRSAASGILHDPDIEELIQAKVVMERREAAAAKARAEEAVAG
ncbi:MAG: beta-N-acetylhexosaminidase [Planctomycetes bacterium]|nr:beta-N-acetylhexosaminidase [Planctomycetota bacterium]